MSNIGETIKELRGKDSLREASNKIGISHTYLDTIEKGYDKRSGKRVNPTPETLKMIAKAYNYSYKKLMGLAGYIDKDENNPEQDEKTAIMNKIAEDFPDAELMFHDLAGMSAEDLQDVYDYIKFKKSQKKD